jgi:hypothetical protein
MALAAAAEAPWAGSPSPAYLRALEECRAHHAGSKTFSGMFLRPHARAILALIDRFGCRSALDYGAGKGEQYAWVSDGSNASGVPAGQTLEQFWRIRVQKYDPAWPPFAQEPTAQHDLVLCTHTLGSIPVSDLGWVIDRIYGLARSAVYIAEKLGDVKKTLLSVPSAHPMSWSAAQWLEVLDRPSRASRHVVLATRFVHQGAVIANRYVVGA